MISGGRLTLFPPLFERGQRVERVGPFTAAAVRHSWREEQSHRRVGLPLAHQLDKLFVVVHRRSRRDVLIGPAVIDEQLAARALRMT